MSSAGGEQNDEQTIKTKCILVGKIIDMCNTRHGEYLQNDAAVLAVSLVHSGGLEDWRSHHSATKKTLAFAFTGMCG